MNRITIVLLSCLLSSSWTGSSFANPEKQAQYAEPYTLLFKWLDEETGALAAAKKIPPNMPYSLASLATVDKNGQPTIRIIQVANSQNEAGIIFYTHKSTVKVQDIKENPKVALNFWLGNLKRQVSIEGKAKKLPSSYAKAAWNRMPRWMQINLTVSDHKSKLVSREKMEAMIAKLTARYKDQDLPVPTSFVAYIIIPKKYVFYSIRSGSFADKFVVTKGGNKWIPERRQP